MKESSEYRTLHQNYQPHIDGIRSVAVLSVVVYHIIERLCPGGFVGVDIFFVLSGFLITRGILHSHENKGFSLIDFYSKRVRRIIPAYALLVLIVLLSSVFIFSGSALNKTLEAGRYSAIFANNFYFYFNTGYMSFDSIYNPLLHLWSLSVEEQFYLVIPVLMFLSLKYSINTSKFMLLGITIASLLLSIIFNFKGYSNFNFFMLPTRAWELFAGALLAYCPPASVNTSDKTQSVHKVLVWFGLALCLVPMWMYDQHTTFPGLTAIPPVLGAVLLIRYGTNGIVGRILKAPISVGIGRLSYSLYLWHWPVIVYANYWSFNQISYWEATIVLIISFILAYISWRFIEMPVRTWKNWNIKTALGLTLVSSTLTIAFVFMIFKVYPFPKLFNPSPFPYTLLDYNVDLRDSGNEVISKGAILGQEGNPSYVLLGDSHARHCATGLHKFSLDTGINGIAYSKGSNFVGRNAVAYLLLNNDENIETFLNWLSMQPNIQSVILVNRYAMYVEGKFNEPPYGKVEMKDMSPMQLESNEEIVLHSMRQLCMAINEMDKKVIFIAPIPELGYNLPSYFYHSSNPVKISADIDSNNLDYLTYKERIGKTERILHKLKGEGLIDILEIETYFFPDKKKCRIATLDNKPFYIDDDHLSLAGSEELFHFLKPQLERMLKANAAPKANAE